MFYIFQKKLFASEVSQSVFVPLKLATKKSKDLKLFNHAYQKQNNSLGVIFKTTFK